MTPQEFIDQWRDGSDFVEVTTSGSTGTPKRMLVEKKRMVASALTTCRFLGLHEGDSALLCMSPDFIAGKMMIVRSLVCGLRLMCIEPSGHPMADVSDQDVFDFAAMVPLQVINSLNVPSECSRLMAVRNLIIGGGPVSDDLAAKLRCFPKNVYSTYGMTETLSHIALRRLNGEDADQWYTPFDAVSVSLTHDSCLVIDAPDICPSRIITNDIADLAPDGRRFRILGRKDNVICSGGLKIQIEELEDILRPRISCDFMITRLPDSKFGEICVMLHTSDDTQSLTKACEALPRYYRPKLYLSTDELPFTSTGKPARAAAAALAISLTDAGKNRSY